jgi:hypothetical protein
MPKQLTRQEKLDALRNKLKTTDLGAGGAGYWSAKEGKNTIRILPEVGDMEYFFQLVGRHYFPDKRDAYCPKFTSGEQKDCPICELVDELYKAGDKASKNLAHDIGIRRSYWMNVIVRGDEDAGVKIFTPGTQIFNQIVNMINDPDYGDIFDVDKGLDIVIDRKGKGLDTKYQVLAKRNSTPLSDDSDKIDEWLEAAKDLAYVEVSEDPEEDRELQGGHMVFVYPFNRLVAEFGLEDFDAAKFEATVEEDAEPDEEDVKPAKRSSRASVADDDDVAPAKAEVNRRMARRSNRR